MNHPVLTLRPLTPGDRPGIVAWFEDPDTQRFLGGPDWPAAMLANADRSIGTTFHGARQTGAHHYVALAADNPVGYIDCGTFERCAVYGGEGPDGPIITESIGAVDEGDYPERLEWLAPGEVFEREKQLAVVCSGAHLERVAGTEDDLPRVGYDRRLGDHVRPGRP